ncbi:MAG TPA: phage tail protein [Polyangiaceae bacterium]|nr:phage tail protein [Polyangiaceae bacterium]
MNANYSSFHLLLGASDWARCFLEDGVTLLGDVWATEGDLPLPSVGAAASAGWLDSRTQELTLRPRLARFSPSIGDRAVELSDRRCAARDRYGNWYSVSDERSSILVRSIGSDQTTTFWPLPAATASEPVHPGEFGPAEPEASPVSVPPSFQALVVTADHHLVVVAAVGAVSEILIFDLFSGGPPQRLRWPADVPLETWDVAPRLPGGFWLLDREGRRLWEFNTYFQVVRPPWVVPSQPEEESFTSLAGGDDSSTGAEPRDSGCAVSRVTLAHAMPLDEEEPIAVEPLPGGGALVLDRRESSPRIAAYRNFARRGEAALDEILAVIDDGDSDPWKLIPHDFAIVIEPSLDMWLDSTLRPLNLRSPLLFVADRLGNQAFCFELRLSASGAPELTATSEFVPMRLFGGRGLVAADDRAYYDGFGRFVPLVVQQRPRYEERAVVISAAFDGDAPGCVWHRVLFEACIPSDASVRIASRATDADGADISSPEGKRAVAEALDGLLWQEEPVPVRRVSGCELPWLRAEAVGGHETWELLLQSARGRYLQLRITLEGDGTRSPRVRALRLYFPRFSYLTHYLPACYEDDVASASFVERFLANFEGLVTAIEDRALGLGALCDPTAAPADFLDWLGRWYAVYLDPAWPPARKRLFLQHALTFFLWRGTARGLRSALRLVFDEAIGDAIFTEQGDASAEARRYRVIEDFRVRALPSASGPKQSPCPGIDATQSTESMLWKPLDGLEALNRRWRTSMGVTSGGYPLTPPEESAGELAWAAFSRSTLGFVPETSAGDTSAWQRFLRSRYASFDAARAAWADVFDSHFASFADLQLPDVLPSNTRALDDWVVFNRYLRPMRGAAHRFTVALPVQPQRARDAAALRVQLHLADRLIALEKPAHTVYRVQLYWALFRVGEVRLGSDTQLGQGSRLPELLPPFVLGEGALAEGRLAPRPEDWGRGRTVLGRNPLERRVGQTGSQQAISATSADSVHFETTSPHRPMP